MTTLQQLTEDEIESMPAGDELDSLVAIHVMGWRKIYADGWWWEDEKEYKPYRADKNYGDEHEKDFSPSIDICMAWQVVEKLRLFILPLEGTKWGCTNVNDARSHDIIIADTAPLAICRVAIRTARDFQFQGDCYGYERLWRKTPERIKHQRP